jgi:hypothetical protein
VINAAFFLTRTECIRDARRGPTVDPSPHERTLFADLDRSIVGVEVA